MSRGETRKAASAVRRACDEAPQPREQGFALIIVIWIAGVLSLLAMSFGSSARVHVRIAENAVADAAATASVDAGTELGLLQLVDSQRQRGRPEPASRACRLPGGDRLALSITDEAGRVDLNQANGALIVALLAGIGVAPSEAERLADAILDYRDVDDDRRRQGAERPDYVAAGLASRPRNAPFDQLEELRGVAGMRREIFEALVPLVTVHSGLTGVDVRVAAAGLMDALARGSGAEAAGMLLPRGFAAATTASAFRVRAAVTTGAGAVVVRETVASVVPSRVRLPFADPDPDFGTRSRARRPAGEPPRFETKVWESRAGRITAAERGELAAADTLPDC